MTRSRSRSRYLNFSGAGNVRNGRLRQPWHKPCIKISFTESNTGTLECCWAGAVRSREDIPFWVSPSRRRFGALRYEYVALEKSGPKFGMRISVLWSRSRLKCTGSGSGLLLCDLVYLLCWQIIITKVKFQQFFPKLKEKRDKPNRSIFS